MPRARRTESHVAAALGLLRSRRFATWLLGGVCAYMGLAALVPQGAGAEVTAWARSNPLAERVALALGLHHAFVLPLFLGAVALLAMSTAACAWERSGRASAAWRRWGLVSDSSLDRLRTQPRLVVPTFDDRTARASDDGSAALDRAETGLRRIGLRVRREPDVLVGTAGRLGLLGSPLFHWSLVLLIVVVAAGRLTRFEGFIQLAEGSSVVDSRAAYRQPQQAPLFPGHTGLRIALENLALHYPVNGLDRGPAPLVAIHDGGRLLARQRVYPNHALQYGRLTIFMGEDSGPAATFVFRGADGVERGRATAAFEKDALAPDRPRSAQIGFAGRLGAPDTRITVTQLSRGSGAGSAPTPVKDRRVVLTSDSPLLPGGRAVLRTGQSARLADGSTIQFLAPRYYAVLSVVDDWSVPWIYALLGLALLGMALSAAWPTRTALVLVSRDEGAVTLHAAATQAGGSAPLLARVREALGSAARGPDG
jgi:cytochrome c biogenesis protein ResB